MKDALGCIMQKAKCQLAIAECWQGVLTHSPHWSLSLHMEAREHLVARACLNGSWAWHIKSVYWSGLSPSMRSSQRITRVKLRYMPLATRPLYTAMSMRTPHHIYQALCLNHVSHIPHRVSGIVPIPNQFIHSESSELTPKPYFCLNIILINDIPSYSDSFL